MRSRWQVQLARMQEAHELPDPAVNVRRRQRHRTNRESRCGRHGHDPVSQAAPTLVLPELAPTAAQIRDRRYLAPPALTLASQVV
jgi:hypothetical protein